jgi:predicted small integral membrane protein
MPVRNLKVVLVASVALLCLFYATQNVVNLQACYQAFQYILGGADHQAFPDSFVPVIGSPLVLWLVLIVVVGLEFTAGLLSAKGAWDLWRARRLPAADFDASKTYALLGCGMGIVVWFGLFAVFGGAMFQMWQTDIGSGSLQHAFEFSGSCALIFLIVNSRDR